MDSSNIIDNTSKQIEEEKQRLAEYVKKIEETRICLAAAEKKIAEDARIEKIQWKVNCIAFDKLSGEGTKELWSSFSFSGCASFNCYGNEHVTDILVSSRVMSDTKSGTHNSDVFADVSFMRIGIHFTIPLSKAMLDTHITNVALAQAIKPLIFESKPIFAVNFEDMMICVLMRQSKEFIQHQ
jgi:hypothetical protein